MVTQFKKSENDETKDVEKEILFDKIYSKRNNSEYKKAIDNGEKPKGLPKYDYFIKIMKKDSDGTWKTFKKEQVNPWGCMPVIPFHQNRLSSDKARYSDANGIVKLVMAYHQIFEGAIDTNLYNGKPTLVFTGLESSKNFIESMYGDITQSGDVLSTGFYENFGSYYLEGNSDAKYLYLNDTVSNAERLLKLLFYIFIQLSAVS